MAVPTSNGILKFLFKFIFMPIIVLIVIIGIAVVVVGSMTPNQLKVADKPLGDESITFRTLELQDTKFFTIIKELKKISKEPKEGDMVKNPANADREEPILQTNVQHSSVHNPETGEIDYTAVVEGKVTYDKEYLLTYDDTTLTYLFSKIIESGIENQNAEAVATFSDMNAQVREIMITVEGTNKKVRIVTSINVKSLVTEANSDASVPGPVKWALNRLPNIVYIVSEQKISANSEGELTTESVSLTINGQESIVADAIFSMIAGKIDNPENKKPKELINDGIATSLVALIKNIGKVGTAEVDSNNVVVGGVELGTVGILNGKITVITYKKAIIETP